MANYDMHNNVAGTVVFAQEAVAAAGTIASATADDMTGFNAIEYFFNWVEDAGSPTAGTTIVKLEDSDDDSVFADVAADFVIGEPLAEDSPVEGTIYRLGYVGKKRYVRLSITAPGGASYFVTSYSVKAVPTQAPTAATL